VTDSIPSSRDPDGATRGLGFAVFRSAWRADVLARTTSLWSEVQLIAEGAPPGPASTYVKQVQAEIRLHLDRVAEVVSNRLPLIRRGGAIATCYQHIHQAEVLLGRILPTDQLEVAIPQLVHKARHLLPPDDCRRAAIESLLVPPRNGTPVLHPDRRTRFVGGRGLTYSIADLTYGQVGRLRNNLAVATIVLLIVIATSALAGYLSPEGLPLCALRPNDSNPSATIVACPTQELELSGATGAQTRQADDFAGRWDVAFVALFGLMGATLSGAIAVSRTRPRSDTPYDLPLYYFLLKLPAGSLTAIVGLFLVNGEFVPGLTALDTQAQILGYAVIFGAAQQIFTRWIDSSARELLDALPGRRTTAPADHSSGSDAGRRRGR
jgi:hypothetical protein